MMGMQSKSSSSKWYHEYRKHHEKQREYFSNYAYDVDEDQEYEEDDMMVCIKKAINKLDPYERMLIEKKVLMGMRYKEIAEVYNIPYHSLSTELEKTLKKLKKQCQHFNY